MISKIVTESDKLFWHGYIPFYEKHFTNKRFKTIAELGILRGHSIKWLLERFPDSSIYGADILPIQPEWPINARVKYIKLDQAFRSEVRDFFNQEIFDLVIEDGSHIPEHQVTCLVEGIQRVSSGGLYILEDIHTSVGYSKGTALTVLLAINHYARIGLEITENTAKDIAKNSLMTSEEVLLLAKNIKNVHLYKRTNLPDSCYNCGSVNYDFSNLRCICGVEIFSHADSMSFVIEKL